MLARCFHSVTRTWLGRVGLIALALVLLPAAVSAAPQPVKKTNECNSDLTIDVAPSMLQVGQMATVTLTVTNTDSRDDMDGGIAQVFDLVTYTGHCEAPPGIPCTPDAANQFVYQGNLGGTCPGVTANDMGTGVVEFDFAPDLSLISVTPPVPPVPVSCTVAFDVSYVSDGSFPVQATTAGSCQQGAFNSDTTVTSVVVVEPAMVPTAGEAALAILALLLAGGAWLTLRRKNAPSEI